MTVTAFSQSLLVRWIVAPHIPLEHRHPDGSRTPAFCWRVSGIYLVHPDRAEQWRAWLAEAGHANQQLDRFPDEPIAPVPFEGFR